MDQRTLSFSEESPALYYQWQECTETFLWICTKREMKKETFDLTKPEIRKMLIDKGFVAKVREKP